MTKEEYNNKLRASDNAGFTPIANYINKSMIKDLYITSLEATINEIVRSLIIAMSIMDDPDDFYYAIMEVAAEMLNEIISYPEEISERIEKLKNWRICQKEEK